jgi:uncharacterized protein (DUF2062 family)
MTPRKLSLCLAFGFTLGVFPLVGSTTVLCTVAAVLLRLNLPAIQIANYLVYPLQLVLLIPFIRAGEKLFSVRPISLSVDEIRTMFTDEPAQAFQSLWTATWHAIVVWAVLAPFAVFLMSKTLTPILVRMKTRWREKL